jgi:OPT family oligopeptide transporter
LCGIIGEKGGHARRDHHQLALRRRHRKFSIVGHQRERTSVERAPMAKTHEEGAGAEAEEVNEHPIEEVRNTVPTTDDPSEPCLTFRTWVLGMSSCVLLSFVNEFFNYRSSQLSIGTVLVQIASLPIGRLMASTLPGRPVRVPLIAWSFSLNPGPFSLKEHCLITIFAGAGCSGVYALNIVAIVKVFYRRQINPYAAMLLAQTTQLLGYGWAGLFRKFLVDSAYMWWPINLVQVTLLRLSVDQFLIPSYSFNSILVDDIRISI